MSNAHLQGTPQPARLAKCTEWSMRREQLSPAYTTRWDHVWTVRSDHLEPSA